MTDWLDRDATPPRVAEWLHAPTGVELFVREDRDDFGAYIRAPPPAAVEAVSIGSSETGRFRTFEDPAAAVA